jgi:hypothetical protein
MIQGLFALILLGGIAAATYLALQGHPWFGLAVLITVGGVQMKGGKR